MLTLKFITDNQETVLAGLAKKGFDGKQLVADILDLDNNRKRTQTDLDAGPDLSLYDQLLEQRRVQP